MVFMIIISVFVRYIRRGGCAARKAR
jgi:hypothetical protein